MRKFRYYFCNTLQTLIPNAVLRRNAEQIVEQYKTDAYIDDRVRYYNKLTRSFSLDTSETVSVAEFRKTGGTTYFFDLRKVIKCFSPTLRFAYINGDVRIVPDTPSFLKSRPINERNENSVLLKLNAVRHFNFIKDTTPFRDKKDIAVWRGLGTKPHRKVVIDQFYDHPKCDIGRTGPIEGHPCEKGFLSIKEQLQYKFILAIEGNDVATNLKWAMSSNSLVIMSKPKYETWFMEGRLKAGVHYVEVKDDYSDLIEIIEYYATHQNEAEEIIENAHVWVEQFKNQKREQLISLLVARKYFEMQQNTIAEH